MKQRCIICNSDKVEYLFSSIDADLKSENKYSLYKCTICGLIFINPLPVWRELESFYHQNYYGYSNGILYRAQTVFKNIINYLRMRLIKKYVKSGRVLDIGCGSGIFLKYLDRHTKFELYGQDISEVSLKLLSNENSNICYFNQGLNELVFSDYFSCITMWSVFEHMIEPVEALNEIRRMLKNKGKLILLIPNMDGLQTRLNLKEWFHLDIPRHIYHYNKESILKLLTANGFKIIDINDFSAEHGIYGWFQTILNILGFRRNTFYRFIKHHKVENRLQLVINFILLPFILIISALLHLIEVVFKRSGIITIVAEKKNG